MRWSVSKVDASPQDHSPSEEPLEAEVRRSLVLSRLELGHEELPEKRPIGLVEAHDDAVVAVESRVAR